MNRRFAFVLFLVFLVIVFVCCNIHWMDITLLADVLPNNTVNISQKENSSKSISLLIRMSGKRKDHQIRLYCNMIKTLVLFWPPSLGKMVLVLDQESKEDNEFALRFSKQIPEHFPTYTFDIKYEPLPNDSSVLAFHRSLKSPEYNRQLWSSFFLDLYTNDDIIGWLDNDSPFILPVTLPTIMTDGKVRILGTSCPMSIGWVKSWARTTERALGFPQVADFMTYFPVYLYRETFTRCREHILRRFRTGNFEEAFKKIYHTGTGFISPVSVVISYAWHFERERYDWNMQICGALEAYNKRFPVGHKIEPKHVSNVLTQPQTAYHGHVKQDSLYAKLIPATFCFSQAAAGKKVKMCEDHPHLLKIHDLLKLFNNDMHQSRAKENPCPGNWTETCLDILEGHFRKIGNEIETNRRKMMWENFEKVELLARNSSITCPVYSV